MGGMTAGIVFIVGRDWKFRALLRAELVEKGFEAMGLESLDEAGRLLASGTLPRLTVFDMTDFDAARDLARLLALAKSGRLLLLISPGMALPQELCSATTMARPVAIGTIVEEIGRRLSRTLLT